MKLKMRKFKLVILLLLFGNFVFPEKLATLHDLFRPKAIKVDKTQMYITEEASVFIYSLEDFRLKKKFGKKGQGPQEFLEWSMREGITVSIRSDYIIVGSRGKVSFFSLDGNYIREIKSKFGRKIKPFEKQFVGSERYYGKDQTLLNIICIYDAEFKKSTEIYKTESYIQLRRRKGFLFFSKPFEYYPCEDKIFVIAENIFLIDVFDRNGEKIFSIKSEYERSKVAETHKKDALDYFKTGYLSRDNYEWYKRNIRFPDYFPAIRSLNIANKKIYARTYKKVDGKTECFIFNTKGKLLRKVFLPIQEKDCWDSYPFTINNGKLYQLIENPETENYELHVTEIEE